MHIACYKFLLEQKDVDDGNDCNFGEIIFCSRCQNINELKAVNLNVIN